MANDEVAARIAALENELVALKEHVAAQPAGETSRRDLFKKLAIAGAGAAVGGVALSATRADAVTGAALIQGQGQEAANLTYIRNGAGGNFATAPLTSEKTMFWVDNRNSTLDPGYGIRGDGHGASGVGVWGHSDFSGIGLLGDSVGPGGVGVQAGGSIGVKAGGTTAAALLTDTGVAPNTRIDAHVKGELTTDATGALWFCVADGTPGTWRKLAGTSTAGQLHLLAAPVRVYDSRPGGTNDGPLAGGPPRVVSLAGTVATPAVPAGATGALVSLTLDATVSSGFLALFANNVGYPGNSNVNWYGAGQIVAVTTVTAVDPTTKVKVLAGGPGSTQFIIDVIGYYL